MIYNIAYHESFVDTLLHQLQKDDLLILPGKYLTSVFTAHRINNCISYDDLWFKILPNRITNIIEFIILNQCTEKKTTYDNVEHLHRAVNEFFYYGIDNLICMNDQHDLLQNTIIKLQEFLHKKNIIFKSQTLYTVLKYQLKSYFSQITYAVLPVIFSPILFKILKYLHEKFNLNIILYGHDSTINYHINYDHAQFFIIEFLKFLKNKRDIIQLHNNIQLNTHKNSTQISIFARQIMYSHQLLYRLHDEQLYHCDHIKQIFTESIASEFQAISNIIQQSTANNIAIVSKDTIKLRLIYHYLLYALCNHQCIVHTTVPTYCNTELRFFFKILTIDNIQDIFEVLIYIHSNNTDTLLLAKKKLLEINDFLSSDIDRIKEILLEHDMNEIVILIDSVLKIEHRLNLAAQSNNFSVILNEHIEIYESFFNLKVSEKILEILFDIKPFIENISLKEYKEFLIKISNQVILSFNDTYMLSNIQKIDILTAIERRFLSYDLTIICDFKEGIWPPAKNDHYFISTKTRYNLNYLCPCNYEIGYAANDFLHIIVSSKEVIISNLTENNILSINKELLKPSRFLIMLNAYNTIGNFSMKLYSFKNSTYLQSESSVSRSISIHNSFNSFSVTSLELLIKNPYLYAIKYQLNLQYLNKHFNHKVALPTHKEFGILLHTILHKITFNQKYSIETILENTIRLKYSNKYSFIMNIWQRRLYNAITFVKEYNKTLANFKTEVEKYIYTYIKINNIDIKISAYVDRMDYNDDIMYISDYKTGQLPSKKEILNHTKPQLHIEGFILKNNKVSQSIILQYIKVNGIQNEIKNIKFDLNSITNKIYSLLTEIINQSSYNNTLKYDNYLQAHIMRIPYIEYRQKL